MDQIDPAQAQPNHENKNTNITISNVEQISYSKEEENN